MIVLPRQRVFSGNAEKPKKLGRKQARMEKAHLDSTKADLSKRLEEMESLGKDARSRYEASQEGVLEASLRSKNKAKAKNLEIFDAQSDDNRSKTEASKIREAIGNIDKRLVPVNRASRTTSQRVEDWISENWKSGDKGKAKVALAAAGTAAAVGTGIYYGNKAYKKYRDKRRKDSREYQEKLVKAYENSADRLMNK